MIGMAANTIFVVSPMTTRHQCAQTTPWPIFKPVILAYFLAGGNNKRYGAPSYRQKRSGLKTTL